MTGFSCHGQTKLIKQNSDEGTFTEDNQFSSKVYSVHIFICYKMVISFRTNTVLETISRYTPVGFLISRMRLTGNFIFEIDCAYQNLKKMPLGGEYGDFILSKLNKQLVNYRVTRKSIFLLHF